MRKAFTTDRATLWHGDCARIDSVIAPESIDAIVTDPPAGISFMGKAWDDDKGGRDQWVAWLRDVMRTALGLLKPGGHALVWALPRTSHWTATAIEDAGFEIRDVVVHLCGTGFPKSLDVFKAIGERCTCGAYDETKPGVRDLRRDVSAQEQHRAIEGEALQSEVLRGMAPSHAARADGVDRAARKKRMDGGEPSVLPELDERREKSSVEGWGNAQASEGQLFGSPLRAVPGRVPRDGEGGRLHHGAPARDGADDRSAADEGGSGASPRPQPVEQHARKLATLLDQRGAQACGACRDALRFAGYGTALKPASEHWILARKPLAGTVAENAIAYGTGGLRIDDCRIDGGPVQKAAGALGGYGASRDGKYEKGTGAEFHSVGRFPANVTLDEWHDPVLRLRNNVSSEVARVIGVYFGQLQDVPRGDSDIPESGEPEEVLRSSVLRAVAIEGTHRAGASELRTEAQRGVAGVNEEDQSRELGNGAAASRMEGRALHVEGLHHRHDERGGKGDVRVDGKGGRLRAATSTRVGKEARAATASVGGGSSPERNQDGQPAAEFGTVGPRNTQARPSGDCEGVASGSSRDRETSIEACESSIPRGWLTYFEDTGRSVRKGAAALLDEQSGVLTSGGGDKGSKDPGGGLNGTSTFAMRARAGERTHEPSEGGASRFFYVAKATRAEKDAGLDHLPLRTGGDATDREEGSAGLNSPRAGSGRMGGVRNHHPTVKSIALMRWLCRLVTPPGGIVLDLFAGSGTTGLAALAEGLRFVGVEREAEFVDVAAGRLAHVECVPVPELTQDGAPKAAPAQPSLFDAIGGAR